MNTHDHCDLYPLSPQQMIYFNFPNSTSYHLESTFRTKSPEKILLSLRQLFSDIEILRVTYSDPENSGILAQSISTMDAVFFIEISDLLKSIQEQPEGKVEITRMKHNYNMHTTVYLSKKDQDLFNIEITTNTPSLDTRSIILIFDYIQNYIDNRSNKELIETQYIDYISWLAEELEQTVCSSKDKSEKNLYVKRSFDFSFSNTNTNNIDKKTVLSSTEKNFTASQYLKIKDFCKQKNLQLDTIITYFWAFLLQQYINTDDITVALKKETTFDSTLDKMIGNLTWLNSLTINFSDNKKTALETIKQLALISLDATTIKCDFLSSMREIYNESYQDNSYDLLISYKNNEKQLLNSETLNNVAASFGSKLELIITESTDSLSLALSSLQSCISKSMAEYLLNALQTILLSLEMYVNRSSSEILAALWQKLPESKPVGLGNIPLWQENILQVIFNSLESFPYETKIAITSESGSITYAELKRAVLIFSKNLQENIFKTQNIIGISLKRDIDYIICLLAIFNIGATALPLSEDYTTEKINLILDDCNPDLIITSEQNNRSYLNCKLLTIDQLKKVDSLNLSTHLEINEIPLSNAAYLIYTSGSTGKAKKVIITHLNFLHYCFALQKAIKVEENDFYAFTASIGFSSMFRQIFMPLCHHATLIIVPELTRKDPALFLDFIQKNKITIIDLIPSFMEALSSYFEHKNEFNVLIKLVLSASEPLKHKTLKILSKHLPAANFINMYGQTETSGIAFTYKIEKNNYDQDEKFVSIGFPLEHTSVIVLNKDNIPTLPYSVGKLYISSPSVAQNVPQDSFVLPNGEQLNNLFNTGDLVKVDSNGTFYYIGRNDQQIKISGKRVNLLEISLTLEVHPAIEKAIVLYIAEENRLVAFIKSAPHQKPSSVEIKHFSASHLESFMIPNMFIYIKEAPITSNGKIDYTKLRELYVKDRNSHNANISSAADNAFLDEYEKEVSKAFCEQLFVESICKSDNFFEIGADSLKSAKAAVSIIAKFDVAIKLTDIFDHPTTEKLAEFVKKLHLEKNVNLCS